MDKIGIFYIATAIYKEYFEAYFKESMERIFPSKEKELIIISDGLKEYDNVQIGKYNIHVEDIIDYPYPIINLCKFQIIEKYAKKYNIDFIMYFDADTYVFEKDNEWWKNLENEINEHNDSIILSYHPHYLYNKKFEFGREYFFPANLAGMDDAILYRGLVRANYCYTMTSFFMCNIDILSIWANQIYEMTKEDLRNYRRIPELSDETYLNAIHIKEQFIEENKQNKFKVYLNYFTTIAPYNFGWLPEHFSVNYNQNNFPLIDSIFINQKFDIKLKDQKR